MLHDILTSRDLVSAVCVADHDDLDPNHRQSQLPPAARSRRPQVRALETFGELLRRPLAARRLAARKGINYRAAQLVSVRDARGGQLAGQCCGGIRRVDVGSSGTVMVMTLPPPGRGMALS